MHLNSEDQKEQKETIDETTDLGKIIALNKLLFEVKEHEISGFTGYTTTCTIFDDQIAEQVEFQVNLSWELNQESIIDQVKRLDIVVSYFSCGLLAMGTYFWRFYGTLYKAMLLHTDTENQGMELLLLYQNIYYHYYLFSNQMYE